MGRPAWYALPDVIGSWLLTGKWPDVAEAVELVPSIERIETKPLAFFGDAQHTIDPQTQDMFTEVISMRREIKAERDAAKKGGDLEAYAQLDARQLGLKLLANGTSYGVYVEVNDEDEYSEARPVTVHALSSLAHQHKAHRGSR